MFSSYLTQAGHFLLEILFGFWLVLLCLRFLLQQARVDYYNPLAQIIIRFSDLILQPLLRYLPARVGIAPALLLLIFGVQCIALVLKQLLLFSALPSIASIFVLSIGELLHLGIYIYMFLIFLRVIVSWISPTMDSPGIRLLVQLTSPLLQRLRSLVPITGGIDWSPLLAIIGLQLMLILLARPLTDWGISLAVM